MGKILKLKTKENVAVPLVPQCCEYMPKAFDDDFTLCREPASWLVEFKNDDHGGADVYWLCDQHRPTVFPVGKGKTQ